MVASFSFELLPLLRDGGVAVRLDVAVGPDAPASSSSLSLKRIPLLRDAKWRRGQMRQRGSQRGQMRRILRGGDAGRATPKTDGLDTGPGWARVWAHLLVFLFFYSINAGGQLSAAIY